MSITLMLADHHPVFLTGLANLLEAEEGFEVLSTCHDGSEAMEAVRRYRPDAAVLDVSMPKMSGLEVARQIKEENLQTKVVIFTAEMEEDQTLAALRLGVQGLLLKGMAPHIIIECIRKVCAGESWVAHSSAMMALEKMLRLEKGARELTSVLTPRELDFVRMVARGLRNKEIASQLCVSEGTVKVHLHNIYDKLNVSGRLNLMRLVQEKGLC